MYYEELDHPCVPKTWNISDDLGQIEYIFSDKTGTLTQNIMEFQKCAVGGVSYGEGITEAMLGAAKREGRDTSAFDPAQNVTRLTERKRQTVDLLNGAFKNRYLREDRLTLISPPMAEQLAARGTEQHDRLAEFWRSLAICHTVMTERPDEANQDVLEYKAESPDEAALVAAARDAGFAFLHRNNHEITLDVMGQPERYVPLRTLAFNSARKRMSTLVRTPDNRVLLICKGADSVILQRLRDDHDQGVIERTTKQLEDFANAGLRTLLISSRYLTDDEFLGWSKQYDQACAAVDDREDEIERACELIEHDLTILGATALEDKLQAGVPEAIAQLHQAGIKLWILTGASPLLPHRARSSVVSCARTLTRSSPLSSQATSSRRRSRSGSAATCSRTRWTSCVPLPCSTCSSTRTPVRLADSSSPPPPPLPLLLTRSSSCRPSRKKAPAPRSRRRSTRSTALGPASRRSTRTAARRSPGRPRRAGSPSSSTARRCATRSTTRSSPCSST